MKQPMGRWVSHQRGSIGEWPFGSVTSDTYRDWDGFVRWVQRDGSVGSEMGLSRMVVASRRQNGSLSPLTLSVSLLTLTLCLAYGFLFFFFQFVFPFGFGLLGQWVYSFFFLFFFFSFFFNIYMGSSLADSVGWFRIFGGGPRLKRKEGPKSSSYYFGGKFTY